MGAGPRGDGECVQRGTRLQLEASWLHTTLSNDRGDWPAACDLSIISEEGVSGLGAHTHTAPDDTHGGKSHIETRWGTTFINAAALTRSMGLPENVVPRSWRLTFTDSSNDVPAKCYLYTSDFAPQGWYPKFDRVVKLSKPFKFPVKPL